MKFTAFPPEVKDSLKYYVYAYVDIESDEETVIYIGKGKGNRCFDHLKKIDDTEKSVEIQRLYEDNCLRIDILAYGLAEDVALKVEAAAIDLCRLDKLYNQKRGDDSRKYGRIHTDKLIARESAGRELSRGDFSDNCILIRINQRYYDGISPENLYESTRGVWKVSPDSVKKVKFALAIFEGRVQEVYLIAGWFDAGRTMYMTRTLTSNNSDVSGRMEFVGRVADEADRTKYRFHLVKDLIAKGAQNPIVYFGPDF